MRIESLKTTPDRAGRYWLSLEDGTKLALYRQTVEDFGLYAGLELTDTELQKLYDAAGAMSAKMRAVRIVTASSVSRKDLEERLVKKGEDPAQAAEAVAWMEQMHLVDDAETARQIVSRCVARGYGINRAKQTLYEKKIPKQYWEAALAEFPDQTDVILSFLRAHLRSADDPKQVKKTIDALLRRGYTYPEVRSAMGRMSLDTDEFPEEM